jgi:hypothetical protein
MPDATRCTEATLLAATGFEVFSSIGPPEA